MPPHAPADPYFIIIAGPNACGKSTTGSALVKDQFGLAAIDPDVLARKYRSDFPELSDYSANLAAVIEAERRVWKALAAGKSVAVETVLSSDKYIGAIEIARDRGYETIFYFVTVRSADIAVARVKERVRLGGHDVPEAKIRERWKRTHTNCASIFTKCDLAIAFDNSAADPLVVAIAEGHTVLWHSEASSVLPDLRAALA